MTTTTFTTTHIQEAGLSRAQHTAAPSPDKLAWAFFLITIACCGGFIGGIIAYVF